MKSRETVIGIANHVKLSNQQSDIPTPRQHSATFTKNSTKTMSDSEDEISDLEADQQAVGSESDAEGEDKPELKGILDDVEETSVSWKDLVSFCDSS